MLEDSLHQLDHCVTHYKSNQINLFAISVDGSYHDFIVVGGGTAGSVLANRLSANGSVNVLLLETGGYPHIESELPGMFMLLKESDYDYNFRSAATNPHQFPVPAFSGNVALDSTRPDYQTINLLFQPNSTDLLGLFSQMFSYSDEVAQKVYEASFNRKTWFSLLGLTLPESRGEVLLSSADPSMAPIVNAGMFSNKADLKIMGRAFVDHIRVLKSTYLKSINATILDLGFCKDTTSQIEYWECYAVAMSTTMWHFGGTCAMGLVLDGHMKVKDVGNLRVVDSSAMPGLISGKVFAPVTMLAERAADLIRTEHNIL